MHSMIATNLCGVMRCSRDARIIVVASSNSVTIFLIFCLRGLLHIMCIVWLYKTACSWLFTLGYEANQNVANDWHRDASDQGILCMPDRFTRFIWFSSRSCFSAAVSSLYFFHSSFCNGIRCSSKFTFPGFRAQFMFCAFFLILFIFLPSACQRRPATLQWLHALLFFVVFFVSDDCARDGSSFCLCCPSFCSVEACCSV